MMTHDEMIAVIQHHKNGGKVEYQIGELWNECSSPSFDFYRIIYRIKPEPRSLWEVRNPSGKYDSVWVEKFNAEHRASGFHGATIHEYKEVLP